MELFHFETPTNLSGYTLVIPSITVGNVPQLSVDLLISTLHLDQTATMWHPALVCLVGSDPFNSKSVALCTAGQLYFNNTLKLAALQFRSTINAKRIRKFLDDLSEGIATLKFSRVVILASLFDYELSNVSKKEYIYAASTSDIDKDVLCNANARMLEKNAQGEITVRGCGFALKLYNLLRDKLDCCLLIKYVAEGDNTFDANIFLKQLFKFICIDEKQYSIQAPPSWCYIYGAAPVRGIF